MILTPVVAARIEVIDLGGAERPGPTEAEDVAVLGQIVVIGVEAGERGRSVRAIGLMLTVVAVISGDAMLLVEYVIALDAPFIDGIDLGSARFEEII